VGIKVAQIKHNEKPLFSIRKKEFLVTPFIDSGKGGQKRNKCSSCCRIKHLESGAVAEATNQRSFDQNKKEAFERLCKKSQFVKWHKIKVAKILGLLIDEDVWVEEQMQLDKLKFEIKVDGKWKQVNYTDIIPTDIDELED
jgi:hypothetical protein